MGMFDRVKCVDPRFVCSEGHDLSDEEFQTKDFECALGVAVIEDARITFHDGALGVPMATSPFTGCVTMYCDCTLCPALVQQRTGNVIAVWCDFEVEIVGNAVIGVKRIGLASSDYLAEWRARPSMIGCEGPMPYPDAKKRGLAIWRSRP